LAICGAWYTHRSERERLLKKVKRRYLALTIDSSETLSSNEFINAVWSSISKLYGEYGASGVNLSLISFDDEKKFAVVRVGHLGLELVKAALAAITKIGNESAAVHVLMVSGTLKSLYKKVKL
jgi:RNase P/RNase MRP subunit POP5